MGAALTHRTPAVDKPAIVIRAMQGLGDNLHIRAVVREWQKTHEVHLETPVMAVFHDFIADSGLKVYLRNTSLHAQASQLQRERHLFKNGTPPPNAVRRNIGYNKPDIDKFGSITQAIIGTAGLPPVAKPDFSLPIPGEWRASARKLIASWPIGSKPILVYRPVTLRKEWDSAARNPDPQAYAALFAEARKGFFVVSLADLKPDVEWIVGPEQSADVKLHSGELDFETMAALFAEAGLVMSPAGFGPVLAQAVGTPNIAVYGRRESFKTADAAGAHLAPTLGIDPDESCDCHSLAHACQKCRADAPKRITLPPAIARVKEFVEQNVERRKQPNIIADSPRVLIFATTFEDCADRANLTDHWIKLHGALNPNCDLLLVDSASPWAPSIATRHSDFVPHPHSAALRSARMVHSFPDNVGHLSRGGRDGWGRAFTYGLQAAIAGRYDYVVHIEGDSLLRLPVRPIIEQMQRENVAVASTPVTGMKNPGSEAGWVETGLMFFRVSYLEQSKFIEQYDWPARQVYPTPEVIVRRLIDDQLRMMPWKAWRSDKNQITHQNVVGLDLDWITHCHNDVWCYDRFLEAALRPKSNVMKVNLGCGDNRLAGWDNHDADVDITKPLPYPDDTVDFVFAEHVVEHVPQKAAFRFFQECRRVLRAGGVMRIAVPAADQIMRLADDDYCAFASKWHPAKGKTRRDALNVIINAHGHEAIWSAASLEAAIYAAGFDTTRLCKPGESEVPELRGVEGHHKMIGQKFNDIETVVCEGYDRS